MIIVEVQQMAFLITFPLIAGGVNTAATKSYETLRSIQVANHEFHDEFLNYKLKKLIEVIGCERNSISFYCLNLFPFKSSSTFSVSC